MELAALGLEKLRETRFLGKLERKTHEKDITEFSFRNIEYSGATLSCKKQQQYG